MGKKQNRTVSEQAADQTLVSTNLQEHPTPESHGQSTEFSNADVQIGRTFAAQPQTTITDFAQLSDGTLLELVEDAMDAKRTLFALWQKRQDRAIQYVTEFRDGNKVFVPRQRQTQVLKSIRLPNRAVPYLSAKSLWEGLEKFTSQCVDVREKYVSLIADFILSTWFVDRFQVAPYLSVVGLPQSGKTTLLKLLRSSATLRNHPFIAHVRI